MRRKNGSGSVVKLSGKRRKPFAVRTPSTLDLEKGAFVFKYLGYFETVDEANVALANYNKGLQVGNVPTLGEIYQRFIRKKTTQGKSEATFRMYENTWKHMEKHKDVPINSIKTYDIQDIIDDLVDRGIGYSTCDKIKKQYSQLFQLAIADDYATKDYSKTVDIPKKPESDIRIFNEKDREKIKANAYKNKIIGTIAIMLFTGLRVGELLNLTTFSVDVNQKFIFGGGKTAAGKKRKIPISDFILPLLKTACDNSEDGYLFPWEYERYLDLYKEALKSIDVEYLSPHKCRKTFSTLLHRSGISSVIITELVGHVDFETTDKYYISVEDIERSKAIETMVKIL